MKLLIEPQRKKLCGGYEKQIDMKLELCKFSRVFLDDNKEIKKNEKSSSWIKVHHA